MNKFESAMFGAVAGAIVSFVITAFLSTSALKTNIRYHASEAGAGHYVLIEPGSRRVEWRWTGCGDIEK